MSTRQKDQALEFLKKMLKEQLCCLGRIFARHDVPSDVTWEVVKGFDLIYQQTKRQAENSSDVVESRPYLYKMKPHPGLTYLLEKIK